MMPQVKKMAEHDRRRPNILRGESSSVSKRTAGGTLGVVGGLAGSDGG